MTTTTAPVVTPERFHQGYTWEGYLESMKVNKDRFLKFYEEFQVQPEDAAFLKRFNAAKGPVRMLVLTEDWCGDCVRGVPVAVRIAEAAGMELSILARDQHMDIMNAYLWRHEFACIPVFVFFDKDWKELGHWIERPASGYSFAAEVREELAAQNLSDEEFTKALRQRRESVQLAWMHDSVTEIREQILYRVL